MAKSEENPVDKAQEDFSWLRDLQKRSWEPEVIISGLTLAFIFAFPAQVYELSATVLQETGLHYIGSWIMLLYLSTIINVFKIFFIVHLVLRLSWAGLLGLSYAFPDGVIRGNLFKASQDMEFRKPSDMVLQLERLCSMAFAFPMTLGIIFGILTFYLGVMLFIYRFFHLDFFTVYILFVLSLIAFSLLSIYPKNSKFRSKLGKTIYVSVQSTYQSNLGKWKMVAYTLLIIGISFPLTRNDTKDFRRYYNQAGLSSQDMEWHDQSSYFEDQRDQTKRFPRAMLSSQAVKGSHSILSLAYYREDDFSLDKVTQNFDAMLDTLNWGSIESATDLYRVFVNDSLIQIENWRKVTMPFSGQKAFQSLIPVGHLPAGVHSIRIEKLAYMPGVLMLPADVRYRDKWAYFTFFKIEE